MSCSNESISHSKDAMARDAEPTAWPETDEEAQRIATGVFSHCVGETNDDTDPCRGCPGWTTQTGDWCGAVYLPRETMKNRNDAIEAWLNANPHWYIEERNNGSIVARTDIATAREGAEKALRFNSTGDLEEAHPSVIYESMSIAGVENALRRRGISGVEIQLTPTTIYARAMFDNVRSEIYKGATIGEALDKLCQETHVLDKEPGQ